MFPEDPAVRERRWVASPPPWTSLRSSSFSCFPSPPLPSRSCQHTYHQNPEWIRSNYAFVPWRLDLLFVSSSSTGSTTGFSRSRGGLRLVLSSCRAPPFVSTSIDSRVFTQAALSLSRHGILDTSDPPGRPTSRAFHADRQNKGKTTPRTRTKNLTHALFFLSLPPRWNPGNRRDF